MTSSTMELRVCLSSSFWEGGRITPFVRPVVRICLL